jgi:hypothetical protein
MKTFATKINDIPCTVVVTHYAPAIPDKVSGPMEDAEEGSDVEFEFYLLDDRNIRAPWLYRQVTEADFNRILDEFEITLLEEKHLYGADDHDR